MGQATTYAPNAAGYRVNAFAIVPPGDAYQVIQLGNGVLDYWAELR